VETRQRHREIKTQPEICHLRRIPRLRSSRESLRSETAFQDRKAQLFVIAAEPGVQPAVILNHGSFDLVETVGAIDTLNHIERMLAAGLVCWEEIAHAARRIHLGHGTYSSTAKRLLFDLCSLGEPVDCEAKRAVRVDPRRVRP